MAGVYTPGMPQLLSSAMTGLEQIPVDTQLTSGQVPDTAYVVSGAAGFGLGTQVVAAAGASLGTATAILAGPSLVLVTVTASTEGVKLPTVATGLRYTVVPSASVGVKVYPAAAGQKISTATTATTATSIAKGLGATFIGLNATTWALAALG